jgi:predicted GTPase
MGRATDVVDATVADTRVMTFPVVAVCEPRTTRGLGPTAMHLRSLLPDAAVVQYTDGAPAVPAIDALVVVVDPLRATLPRHLGRADVVVVDDALAVSRDVLATVLTAIHEQNGAASVIRATSSPRVEPGASLMDTAVLVIEDGATVTDGHTAAGPGTLAAVDAEVGMRVDPRPFAVGSLVETYLIWPQLGAVLPVMAYDDDRLAEVEATIRAVACDAVVDASAIVLADSIAIRQPVRRVIHDLRELTAPTLAEALRLFTHLDSVSPPMPAEAPSRTLVPSK